MINKGKETMKIRITGDRGNTLDKSVVVEVKQIANGQYIVKHVDGRSASVGVSGGSYGRMVGTRYVCLLKNCFVEKV